MPPPPPPRKGKSGGLGPGPPLPGGGPGPPAGTKLQPNWAFWRNQREKKESCEKVCCERFLVDFEVECGFLLINYDKSWLLLEKLEMKRSEQLRSQKHKHELIDDLQDAQCVFRFVMIFVVQRFCTWAFLTWKINTWKQLVERNRGMVTNLFSLQMLANAASCTSAPRIKLSTWANQRVTGSSTEKNKQLTDLSAKPTTYLFSDENSHEQRTPSLNPHSWGARDVGGLGDGQGLYPPKLNIESSRLVHHPLDWKIIFHQALFLGRFPRRILPKTCLIQGF